MLKNFQKLLGNDVIKFLTKLAQKHSLDPAVFNDPNALKVSWKYNKAGGANFTTHIIDKENLRTWTIKKTLKAKIFGAIFMLPGFFMFYQAYLQPKDVVIFSIVGSIFVLSGYLLISNRNDIKIDFVSSLITTKKVSKSFDEVIAIQIIEERVKKSKSSFYSYELNLVFSDYTRLTVLDHGNLEAIQESSREFAQKFNCPVWDSSRENIYKIKQRKVS